MAEQAERGLSRSVVRLGQVPPQRVGLGAGSHPVGQVPLGCSGGRPGLMPLGNNASVAVR